MKIIASVNFPKQLYRAFQENNVVVFAGAGVSMGKPSGLPNFSDLADKIAESIGKKPRFREKDNPLYEPIDLFLDQLSLNDKAVVNRRAAEILNDRYKKPNDLHLNIIKLFNDIQNIRIVTTNFDRLFTKAFYKVYRKKTNLKIYANPALPLGRDFNGIIHLHGSLAEPEHMVLTRTDFGRAYLTDGGVRRFLLPLFQKYTVLFIGYSLDDVVMDYMQRALPYETMEKRYVLTESKADDYYKWKSLGVEPIRFKKTEKENPYSNLYELIEKLASRLSQDLIDWEKDLKFYCSRNPRFLDAETEGQIIEALEDKDIVKTFSHVNRNEDWVIWVYERGILKNLFKETELNEIDRILGEWVSYFSNTHPDLLAGLIKKANYHLHSWFWHQLLWTMGKNVEVKNVTQFLVLLQILLNHAPPNINPCSVSLLASKCKQLNLSLGLYQILSFLLSHSTHLAEDLSYINTNVEESPISYHVSHDIPRFPMEFILVWNECFLDNDKLDKELIFQIILSKFNALGVETLFHKNSFYSIFKRKAIEKAEDKYREEPLDDLVDFIRAYMSELDQTDSELFFRKLILLLESPFSLLRRIAIDSLRLTKGIKLKEKFDLVLSKVEIDDWVYKNELFLFFRDNFPSLNPSDQDDYVKLIDGTYKSKYKNTDKERLYYRDVFDWLEWLDRRPHKSKALKDLLLIIREKYPDMEPKEYPGYSFGSIEVIDAFNSPLTEQELITISDDNFIDYMVNFKDNLPFAPDRMSLLSVLLSVVSKNPNWGVEKLILLSKDYPNLNDVFISIFNGIAQSDKTNLNTEQLLNSVPSSFFVERYPKQFLDIFIGLLKLKEPPLSINRIIYIDKIVEKIWDTIENEEPVVTSSSWLTTSINSLAGNVVEYWIKRFEIEANKNEEQTITHIETYKSHFVKIINGNTSREKLARPILCNVITFLFFHDYEWVKNNLIPLFESSDDDTFRQAWEGFLYTSALSDELVNALHGCFLKAIKRVNIIHDSIRARFAEFYAYIVIRYINNPIDEWIIPLLVAENNKLTIEFANQLRHTIHHMKPEDRQILWKRWYKTYLRNRKDNIPVVQLEDEIRAYLDGILDFDFALREIVDLITQFNNINLGHSALLYHLEIEDKWLSYVDEVTDLLLYLADCNFEYWHEGKIKNVIKKYNIKDSEKFSDLDNKLRKHGIFINEIS